MPSGRPLLVTLITVSRVSNLSIYLSVRRSHFGVSTTDVLSIPLFLIRENLFPFGALRVWGLCLGVDQIFGQAISYIDLIVYVNKDDLCIVDYQYKLVENPRFGYSRSSDRSHEL